MKTLTKPKTAGPKIRDLAPKKDVKGGTWGSGGAPKSPRPHALHVYEDGADEWYVGLRCGRWARPLSKERAIEEARLRAAQEGIREIGVYNQTRELLETLAV
jgi:hypothetical protein